MITNLEEPGAGVSTGTPPALGAANNVSVAAPESWVLERDLDREYRPGRTGAFTVLLLDEQHNAPLQRCFRRVAQRLETLQAVHQAAQWTLDFDPRSQRVTIHSIVLLRGEEHFEHANPDRFRYLQREAGLEHLVLDGCVSIVALLEDVRVGDILDVSYTVETHRQILAHRYSALCQVSSAIPVRAFYFSVRFPTGQPMRRKCIPEAFEPDVREIDGETEWTWMAERMEQRELEPGVPAGYQVGREIQISDCESWAEFAAAVHSSWKECFDDTLENTARTIAASAATPIARAEMALRLAQDEIRYLSNNIELGGQIPTSPAVVLRQRFGDCKDKSFLLAHLLRRLGIPARPVLVNTVSGRLLDQRFPVHHAFNHVVIEYEIEGERRTVDATMPLQGGGPLNRGIPTFGHGLPIGPDVVELEPISTPLESEDFYQLREVFYIDTTGASVRLKWEITARGLEADSLRASLALRGQEAVSQQREEFYRQLFPDVRRIGTLEWRDDRGNNEIILAELLELPNALILTPERDGYAFQHRAHLIQSVLGFPESKQRDHPFALRHPCRVEHVIELQSGALGAQASHSFGKRDQAFRFSCESQPRPGRWTLHYRLQTFTESVAPKDFGSFKRKVMELWPYTLLHTVLAPGVPLPRRRSDTSLLPPSKGEPKKAAPTSGQSAGAISPASPDQEPLPSEAAPTLTSLVRTKKEAASAQEDASTAPASTDNHGSKVQSKEFRPRQTVALEPSSRGSHRRSRRRRRSPGRWPMWLSIAILAAGVVTLWYLMLSHQ